MPFSPKIQTDFQYALQGGVVSRFFSFFMGRCTFFAIVYSVVGIYGWLIKGRDLTSFALFMGAAQSLLVLHSWKQDVAEQRAIRNQKTTVVVENSTNTSSPS